MVNTIVAQYVAAYFQSLIIGGFLVLVIFVVGLYRWWVSD